MGKYNYTEHHGDSTPKRVKFANFLATPFIGVLFLVSRLTGTEVQVQFGPSGMCRRERREKVIFAQMGAMFAKYSDDVLELAHGNGATGAYLRLEMHEGFMRGSEIAREMDTVIAFAEANNLQLGDGKPRRVDCEVEFIEDSHDTSESQPKGDK